MFVWWHLWILGISRLVHLRTRFKTILIEQKFLFELVLTFSSTSYAISVMNLK